MSVSKFVCILEGGLKQAFANLGGVLEQQQNVKYIIELV